MEFSWLLHDLDLVESSPIRFYYYPAVSTCGRDLTRVNEMKLDEHWCFDALIGTEELGDVQDVNVGHDLLNA